MTGECSISESENASFVVNSRMNAGTNRREYSLYEIKTSETGVASLNDFKSFNTSMFENHYFSKIIKINNDAFFIYEQYNMIGYIVELRKINLESKEETIVRDFTREEENSGRNVRFLFSSSSINNKIYIEARFNVDLEDFVDLPIYGGGETEDYWRSNQKIVHKLFSLSTQDGTLSEVLSIEDTFVDYRTIRSGDIIYIVKNKYFALPNSVGGFSGYNSEVTFLNLQNQAVKVIEPKLDVSNYAYSLSNASILLSRDYTTEPSTVKVIIPPAISGGEFIENDVFNTLNAGDLDFGVYYDEIIFNFRRDNSNVSELGILKRDGTTNIFEQVNATTSGKLR